MLDDWKRFELYLDIADKGFFLIETCEYDIVEKILLDINQKKKALFVDFSKHTPDYYNTNFDRSEHNCVVFYNLQFFEEAVKVIDSFNMNRDNFAANNIVYIFILPKYLADYLTINTPNLHSYMTGHIELKRTYEPPFRPLLSLDNFVIDKKQIREERIARRDYKTIKNIKTYKDLFYCIEYYKYNRASKRELIGLLESAVELYKNDIASVNGSIANVDTSNLEQFYVEFMKVSFYQDREELAEYAGMLALSVLLSNLVVDIMRYDEYNKNVNLHRQEWYAIIRCEFKSESIPYIKAIKVIEVARFFAATLFYKKEYKIALDWFYLINEILDLDIHNGYQFDNNIKCMNTCDIVLCKYKLNGDRVYDEMYSSFDYALSFRKENDLDIKTLFVLDYNDLVYKIMKGHVRYEDYIFSEGQAEYYKKVCSEKSSIFASYLSLVAWIRGCIDGNLEEALELNRYALALKRQVLTENHYSIAESHYCNAVLYLLKGDALKAIVCRTKAYRILSVNSERNHTFLEIIKRFDKEYVNTINSLGQLKQYSDSITENNK